MAKYNPNPKLQDKDWLNDQYNIQLKSLKTIATELNVTVSIVSKYAKRYGFIIRNRGESRAITLKQTTKPVIYDTINPSLDDRDWLYQKYVVEGLAMRQIIELVGLSNRRTLKRALKFHNIPIRNLKDARQNRTKQGRTKKAPNPIIIQHREEILSSYRNRESIRSIRRRLGLSRDALYKLLTEEGVLLRSSGEANIGRKHSSETITKMSKTATNQILAGIRSSHSNGRRVNTLTPNSGFIAMRSTWEKKYAEHLKTHHIDFIYEHQSFLLSNGKSYIADFYLPTTDEYIEIKGYLSQGQEDKYELFRKEYPNIKWKILYRESLVDLGIDLQKDIPTVYLLIGAPSAGKSWVANQLTDKFDYISFDNTPKSQHIEMLKAPSDKPKLYDPTFKISTIIKRHSHEFNFVLVAIYETEDILRSRIASRNGTWTDTILKRNEVSRKRYNKYGKDADGFIGTSSEALEFLKNI